MMDALLFAVITGTVLLALGVDITMLLTWLTRRRP
jgi:hypothetical protein